jgi:hypothetical protein
MLNGGSFAASIAKAYFCADSNNQKILTTAFKDLFNKYAPQKDSNNIRYIIDHINACAPCTYSSIKNFSDSQLPDSIDIAATLQMMINSELIDFCHESKSFSVNN